MSISPWPVTPAILLTTAARLGFHVTARNASGVELGVFTDGSVQKALILVGGVVPGSVAWMIEAPTKGFVPWLISRATYEVLRGGTVTMDGSILYEERRYRVRAWFAGEHLTAEALPEDTAAA